MPYPYICIENKTRKIMKTKNVLLIALMAMSVSVLASVNEPGVSKVVVVTQKSGLFKVIYEGIKAGKVSMKITDSRGNVVFAETIKSVNGFIRPVNFAGMEPGVYNITITDENGAQVNTIKYNNTTTIKNVHIAKIAGGNRYLLAVANQGTEEINVRIFDGDSNLVHDETLTIKGNFGLVYNLKEVAGTPTFEVTDKTGNDLVIK